MAITWRQPICEECWETHYPYREPLRVADCAEVCCFCAEPTASGIYIRINPYSVPFPQDEDGPPKGAFESSVGL